MSCKQLSAMGIPVGSELEFAHEVTVLKSMESPRDLIVRANPTAQE